MPLKIDDQLVQQLVNRQMVDAENIEHFSMLEDQIPKRVGTANPTLMSILGSAADGASTYQFMKNGGAEDNAMYGPLKNSPLGTGLAVAGTGLAGLGLSKLLGRKFPDLANVLLANQAAQQVGISANNFTTPTSPKESSVSMLNNGLSQEVGRTHRSLTGLK